MNDELLTLNVLKKQMLATNTPIGRTFIIGCEVEIISKSCAAIDSYQAMIAICILHGSFISTRSKHGQQWLEITPNFT